MSPHPEIPATRRLPVAAVGGLVFALAFPAPDLGLPASVAGLGLLGVALLGASVRSALLVGLTWGTVSFGVGCFWVVNVFGPVGFLLVPVIALSTVAFALLARLVEPVSGVGPALAGAALWAGLEMLRGEFGPLANTSLVAGASVPGSLMGPARYVGVYGVSFLAASLAFLLAGAVVVARSRGERRTRVAAAAAVALVWGLVAGAPLPVLPEAGPSLRILAVQAVRVPLDRLEELTRQGLTEAGTGVDLVVWPEYAVEGVFVEEDSAVRLRLADLCRRHGVALVFGNKRRHPGGTFFNTAFLMDRDGTLVGGAGKSKPVPFLNDGDPTAAPEPVAWGRVAVGFPICYDADFSLVCRGVASRGAGLLITPTRDNRHWGWFQHMQRARMLRLRGVETGLDVLRVNGSGPTVIVRPDGSYGQARWDEAEGWLLVTAQPRRGTTPYVALGWVTGPLLLLVGLGAAGLGWSRRRGPGGGIRQKA